MSKLPAKKKGLKDITNPRQRYLDWSITINNYSDNDIENIRKAFDTCNALYACIGKEVGANGTPHLQAHLSLGGKGKRRPEMAKIIPKAHLEAVQYIRSHAEYCRKDGDFEELGREPAERSVRQHRGRSDEFEDAIATIKGGVVDSPTLRRSYPRAWSKHERTLRQLVRDARPPPRHGIEELYPWQQDLLAELDEEPDDRKIVFYVDYEGRAGKTTFTKFLLSTRTTDVQFFATGKKEDIFHAVKETTKIFLFDVPRGSSQFLQYPVLESIKNGLVFSPKYDSCNKCFPTPHVIVFMNEDPTQENEKGNQTLSEDRWDIRFIENPNKKR